MSDNEHIGTGDSPLTYKTVIAAHKAENERLKHEYSQLKEAYDAKESGVPLGPIVGAQTILNQAMEIKSLRAQLAAMEEAANQREIFYANVMNDAERMRVLDRDKLAEMTAEWDKLRFAYDVLSTDDDELMAENGRLTAALAASEARADRLFKDRYDLLNVTSKDGLSSSEWLMRTATAEARVKELEEAARHCDPTSAFSHPLLAGEARRIELEVLLNVDTSGT